MAEDETADVVTVMFTGVAEELFAPAEGVVGAPMIWAVNVTSDEEGALCSDVINVTVYQATEGPWGAFDANITVGDEVEVFGAYDEAECSVTLEGSLDYYFELAVVDEVVEEDVVEDEVVEDEVVEEDVVEETEETTEEVTE